MKCSYCGNELQEKKLYCDQCGKEVQIVPDYNEFEEEVFNNIMQEEEESSLDEEQKRREERMRRIKRQKELERQKAQKTKKILILVISITVVAALIAISIFVFSMMNKNKQNNSYAYQLEQGKIAERNGNIEDAISYYTKAADLDKKDIVVRYLLVDLYLQKADYNNVIVVTSEIITMDRNNVQAYEALILALDKKQDFDAIEKLSKEAPKDDRITSLFEDYLVVAPDANMESGTYEEFFDLEFIAGSNMEIYYTDNGDDPTGTNGILYTDPISISEPGKYKYKVVSKNTKGLYSEIVTFNYEIDFAAPVTPYFSESTNGLDEMNQPLIGAFYLYTPEVTTGEENTESSKQLLMIQVPENCKAYYEWNNATPSVVSKEYNPQTGIEMMEGTNIFYVIFIDERNGKCSSISSKNFEYFPE